MTGYSPAWWLPGPHAQTIWGKLFRHQPAQPTEVERWETPDGDFIDIHRLKAPPPAPRLILLHGLEGTIQSNYAQGFLGEARRRGWAADMLIFRSCGQELNRTKRFYHSGETTDLAFVIDRILAEIPRQPMILAGVSLGGNVLLKYLGERGTSLPAQIKAAAAISVPFDLRRASKYIDRGFSRLYQRHFIRSLKQKAIKKLARFPDLVAPDRLSRVRTMYEFDDLMTAPLHGFADAADYYSRSSALGWIDQISIPTLLLSSFDDPFLPREVLDEVDAIAQRNPALQPEFSLHGGHVGFVSGHNPFRPSYYAERRACDFLADQLARRVTLSA
jgi:predicted alpha/beta-fold hydrolase